MRIDEPRASSDCLRLDRCPDCSYLLTGLPERGLCPECGFAYEAEMIVLYGWAGQVRRNEANQRPGAVRTAMVWLQALLVGGLIGGLLIASRQPAAMFMGLLIIAAAVRIVHRRYRLLSQGPAPVQLRLFQDGCAQRDGIGRARLRPWRRGRRLRVRRVWGRRYRIRSYRWYLPAFLGWRHIDFMFRSDPATAARVQARIEQWQAVSRQVTHSCPE